jgi:hypothetical protein
VDGDVGRLPDAAWDMTLGGFNQDLPAPGMPCEERDLSTAQCAAISGVLDGEPVDVQAYGRAAYVFLDGGYRAAALGWDLADGELAEVVIRIGMQTAPIAPATFSASSEDAGASDSYVGFSAESRAFESHVDGMPIATHEIEWRIAGELWFAQNRPDGPRHEQVLASFALSITPKPDCTKDADGLGCETLRLRGTTIGATLRDKAAP